MNENEVGIKVTGEYNGTAFKTAKKDVAEVGDEAKKTSTKVVDLDASFRKTGRSADRMGDEFDGASRDAGQLARRLIEARAAASGLAHEFDRTGDTGVLRQFEKATLEVNRLQRAVRTINVDSPSGSGSRSVFSSLFGNMIKDAQKSGTLAGEEAIKGFADVWQAVPPEMKAAGAAVGVVLGTTAGAVAASFVGAALAGAVLGGAGGGVLALGISQQLSDGHVEEAIGDLKIHIADSLYQASRGFVPPMVYGIKQIEQAWSNSVVGISGRLDDLSKFIVPLSVGLSKMFSNAQPGILKALDKAGPILQDIADELPGLGNAISDAFEDISGGSKGAEKGIRSLFMALEIGIRIAGRTIEVLAKLYDWFINTGEAASRFVASWLGWMPVLGDHLNNVHDNFKKVQEGAEHVEDPLNGLGDTAESASGQFADLARDAKAASDAFDVLFGLTMNVEEANIAVHQALDDLQEAFEKNGRTLDDNTQKGRDNHEAVLSTIQALKDQRDAEIRASDGSKTATDAINENYNRQIAALQRTYPWIKNIAKAYEEIPRIVITDVYIREHTNVYGAYTGAHTGSSGGKEGGNKYRAGGIVGAAAAGGPRGGGWVMVGENGPEYARMPPGTPVMPAANTNQMMANGAGGGTTAVVISVEGDQDSMMLEWLHLQQRQGNLKIYQKAIV